MVCRSPTSVTQLLESGLPTVLAQGLAEFCSRQITLIVERNLVSDAERLQQQQQQQQPPQQPAPDNGPRRGEWPEAGESPPCFCFWPSLLPTFHKCISTGLFLEIGFFVLPLLGF